MISKEELIDYIRAKQREIKSLSKNSLNNINNPRLEYYKIKEHVDNFLEQDGEYYNRLIMMPGLRGVGKTTILYQLYEYLIKDKNIDENNVFYLDVDDLKAVYDLSINEIFNLFLEDFHQSDLIGLNKKIFLFVDEAQLDKNWAKYAKLIFDKSVNVFMVFTGSSALNLEVNTDAARRITKEKIFPCNFQEYLLLNHNLNLSHNNFKDLILKGDEESINKAIECESIIKKDLIKLNNDLEIEFKKFLHSQSFPFSLNLSEDIIHRLTNDIVTKIIYDDLKPFKNFNNVTPDAILRLVSYLATKKVGTTSNSAIAQSLSMSVKTVRNVLYALEKTQLIFSVDAYGSGGKMLNKPSHHLFLTPSIQASLNYRIGRYDLNHEKCYSALLENLVGSTLYRLSEESMASLGLFYAPDKKGADFIVKHLDRIIPIEVGIGKKTKSQLTISKNKFDADYGILISNRKSNIEFKNGIIYISPVMFALMG